MTDQTASPEETLTRILESLKGGDPDTRLAAIQELHQLNYTSNAVRVELEHLALKDDNEKIRAAALAALDLPTNRHIQRIASKLGRSERYALLKEIEGWVKSDLLDKTQADVLKRRYDFDISPLPPPLAVAPVKETITSSATPTPPSTSIAEQTKPAPRPAVKSAPAEPRPTLLQTLLSEISIKIALYLGAFFVIASAVILGALVASARLPILIIGTIVFGAFSISIRKRLPQPSFAIFIVFSFLLPITASVLEESLNLSGQASAVYWTLESLLMAIIWAISTWLYRSRLFSIASLIALAILFYNIGGIFKAEPEFRMTMTGVAALAGLFGTRVLKGWKDSKFALPLFISAQILQGIVLLISFSLWVLHLFESSLFTPWNLASAVTWGLAFVFFLWSDALYPFILFRWFAATALIPIPWFGATAYNAGNIFNTILFFSWGMVLAFSSEVVYRVEAIRKYCLPLLVASSPAILAAIATGFSENTWFGIGALLGIALVYGIVHAIRPRGLLWAVSLLAAIGAYFTFFDLPFFKDTNFYFGYELVAISLLFLLPDIIIKADFNEEKDWRVPPRIYGVIFTIICIPYLVNEGSAGEVALCFAIFTIFFVIFTLVQRKPLFGYIPAASLPVTIFYVLQYSSIDAWLPSLTALAVLYFAIGYIIRAKSDWSQMFRDCSLALGTLISVIGLILQKERGEWCALVIGLLFVAEIFLTHNGWFEIGAPVLFSISAYGILHDLNIENLPYHLLAFTLIWFGTDVLAHIVIRETRPLKWLVRGIGGILALANGFYLFYDGISNDPLPAAICFGIYSLFFLTYSLFYRKPVLGYTFTASLSLFGYFLYQALGFEKWLFPLIMIAIAFYATGYFMRRREKTTGWDVTLLFSGLGLGTIVSLLAPLQGGLDISLPVALAATLWAVEAFARKNVWLGFPANALYLLAYFMILIELKVDEPQYFSIGTAMLGMIMHYLLTRAGSKTGALITGMASQLVLLGTTYIQMLNTERLIFFVVLFLQSLIVLIYGITIRSRSLVLMPIVFSVLGVFTVVYSALKGISTVVLIGCTGIILLVLGILAVVMKERITRLGERLSDWQA